MILNKGNHQKYLVQIQEKIFHQLDKDHNNMFSRTQFPKVLKMLTAMIGADVPLEDDVDDLFNLIDASGDGVIDKKEFMSLIKTLFRVLQENDIEIKISEETNIVL